MWLRGRRPKILSDRYGSSLSHAREGAVARVVHRGRGTIDRWFADEDDGGDQWRELVPCQTRNDAESDLRNVSGKLKPYPMLAIERNG